MSDDNAAVDTSCENEAAGVAEVDGVKLKKFDACDLVKYCSNECRKYHKSQHAEACEKRAAELRDEILFKQPESNHLGDCPICFLPLPIGPKKSTLMVCCSTIVCGGCCHANLTREIEESLFPSCPFCRHPPPESQEEVMKNIMKRVEANDPVALWKMGRERYEEGDYNGAFQYWTKAAGLGNAEAHYELSCSYAEGEGVEIDEEKRVYHLEHAAIGGNPRARYNLGCEEAKNRRMDRAIKHFIIAANLGHNESLEVLKNFYAKGHVSKDDFAAALRGHQAAVDATKSPQREMAFSEKI